MVELLGGSDEAEVPLLDKIQERDPTVTVLLGDGDHEPQVGLNETILAPLVAAGDTFGEAYLVGVRQEPYAPDLRQVHPDGVAGCYRVRDLHRGRYLNPRGRAEWLGT